MKDLHFDLASQQLTQLNDNAKFILVHPNYRTSRYILDKLVTYENAVYLCITGSRVDSAQLKSQLETALEEQTENSSLSSVKNLILDECDRADEDSLNVFLNDVSQTVVEANQGRIFIISRTIPRFITEKDNAQLIPVDEELLLCNYIRKSDDPAKLEVHSFGTGRVFLNGEEINSWEGVLPRSLFFYLVDKGMTTRESIFEIFWPNLSTKEATNVFHVTKRKISEVLGRDLTKYWSGFYRISPEIELNYDAMTFSKMVQDSAVSSPDDAQVLLQRAIKLYRGEFLKSMNLEWVQERRATLLQEYGEALISLAKMFQNHGNPQKALGFYLRSAHTNPQREDLVKNIMLLYKELGMIEDALICYERLEEELSRSLGVKPAPELQALAAELRANGT